jgi:hypothetical protein
MATKKKSHKAQAMELAERAGFKPHNSEWHNPFTHTSYDLFGFIDFVAFDPIGKRTLAVQACSAGGSARGSDVQTRVKKCLLAPELADCLSVNWLVEVWGILNDPRQSGATVRAVRFKFDAIGQPAAFKGSEIEMVAELEPR